MKEVHQNPAAKPPLWAEALLRTLLAQRSEDTIAGDLLEEYRESVLPDVGTFRARIWYLRQVMSFLSVADAMDVAVCDRNSVQYVAVYARWNRAHRRWRDGNSNAGKRSVPNSNVLCWVCLLCRSHSYRDERSSIPAGDHHGNVSANRHNTWFPGCMDNRSDPGGYRSCSRSRYRGSWLPVCDCGCFKSTSSASVRSFRPTRDGCHLREHRRSIGETLRFLCRSLLTKNRRARASVMLYTVGLTLNYRYLY
jgi:hypothetical protein